MHHIADFESPKDVYITTRENLKYLQHTTNFETAYLGKNIFLMV